MDAFEVIVARFEGRLFNFIARRLGSGHRQTDAEDLTQESFLRAWRSVGEYRPHFRFSTWLFTIAARLVVDHQRHRLVRLSAADALAEAATERAREPDRSEREDDRFAGARLWHIALQILTDEQHAALWLRYAEDLSPGEVARVLNKNEVAVRVMLFRARQALASHMPEARQDGDQCEGSFRREAAMTAAAAGGVT